MKRFYNTSFPIPPYLNMNTFAIDISDQSIKYGQLVATPNGLLFTKYGREKIPTGIVSSGKIINENELVKILEKIKKQQNIKFIRVSLPEEQMYLFSLSILKNDKVDLKNMILLQIEEYIPLKANDTVFNYDVIKEDEQNILVEVVALAKQTVLNYLSVFEKAGLVAISFEIEAHSIARSVIPPHYTHPVMVVDFGETRTGISISNNGHVVLTTTLPMGGSDLINMIAKNFSLTRKEAEQKRALYKLNTTSKAEDIFPAILNGLSVLRDELNKQSLYWEMHGSGKIQNEKIDHIILCGGDANLIGLIEYLEASMKVKVENANVWTNIIDINKVIPELDFEESLGYATVLGLALGSYVYKSQPLVNILPDEQQLLIKKEYRLRFLVYIFNSITILVLIIGILFTPAYLFLNDKKQIIDTEIEKLNKENPELIYSDIDKISDDINIGLNLILKDNPKYLIVDNIFKNILSSITPNITLTHFSINKNEDNIFVVDIGGVARDRDSLRDFKISLDNNDTFINVNLPISDYIDKNNLDFLIKLEIK